MERYRFSEKEQALMESMDVPFAVFQLVEQRIVTIVVTRGFCALVGLNPLLAVIFICTSFFI